MYSFLVSVCVHVVFKFINICSLISLSLSFRNQFKMEDERQERHRTWGGRVYYDGRHPRDRNRRKAYTRPKAHRTSNMPPGMELRPAPARGFRGRDGQSTSIKLSNELAQGNNIADLNRARTAARIELNAQNLGRTIQNADANVLVAVLAHAGDSAVRPFQQTWFWRQAFNNADEDEQLAMRVSINN